MASIREVLRDLVSQAPVLSGDRQGYLDAVDAAFPDAPEPAAPAAVPPPQLLASLTPAQG